MLEEKITKYLERHGFERFAPKAVLFDMDGVLYDSMPHHDIAWQQSMNEFGLTMPPMGAYQYEGMRGPETIQKLAREQWGKELTEEEAQQMYDRKSAIFTELGGAEQMHGILDLMHANGHSRVSHGMHQVEDAKHLFCTAQFGEDGRLTVIHFLCLFFC